MAKTGLPLYVMRDKQRDGSLRWLFRRKGFSKVTLPSPAQSKEFWAAYAAALNGQPVAPKTQMRSALVPKPDLGTLERLCDSYYASGEFKQGEATTQQGKRWVLNK